MQAERYSCQLDCVPQTVAPIPRTRTYSGDAPCNAIHDQHQCIPRHIPNSVSLSRPTKLQYQFDLRSKQFYWVGEDPEIQACNVF